MWRRSRPGSTAMFVLAAVVLGLVRQCHASGPTDSYEFEKTLYTVAEDMSVATVCVIKTDYGPANSTIDITTSDGTALAGTDYNSITATMLSYVNEDTRVCLNVSIIDNDQDDTGDTDIHCFTLTLSNPALGGTINSGTAQVCIIDNDSFFQGTCPPMEAVIESNGEAVIEVNVTSGSDTAVITWTDPMPTGMEMGYTCTPILPGSDIDNKICVNGDKFPITGKDSTIEVLYTVYRTFDPIDSLSCKFGVRVLDPIPPEIICPSSFESPAILVNNTIGTANWTAPVGTDNSEKVTTTTTTSRLPPYQTNIGSREITYTAVDSSGNEASCSFNVVITDVTKPVIVCPATIENKTDTGMNFSTVMWDPLEVTDNSGEWLIPVLPVESGSQFGVGNHTVYVTATDSHNNTGNCSFEIMIQDCEDPVITCPANLTVATDSSVDNVTFALPDLASAFDNSGVNDVDIVINDCWFTVGQIVTLYLSDVGYQLQYTASDSHGNNKSCNTSITVVDEEKPNITCPIDITSPTETGEPTASLPFANATTWDNSMMTVTLSANATSGDPFSIGETVVEFVATDDSMNTNNCTFTITVKDDEKPEVECPMNIENKTDDEQKYATVMWLLPNVTDNSNEIIPPALSHTMEFMFPIGLTLVKVNATDSSSNTGSCNFTVNVLDLEPPEITCPGNQTNSTDPNVPNVSLAVPAPLSASDNSESFIITVFDIDGMTYMVGDPIVLDLTTGPHLLQYVITDTAWNDTCDMYITVIDDEDPELTCPEAFTVGTDLGLATANVSWDLANVTDNSMESITPVSDPVSGSVLLPIGDTTVRFNATDKSGNNGSCTFLVTVEDMEHPMINCSTNYTFSTSPGLPTAYVTYNEPEATDNVELFTTRCFPSGAGHELNVGFYTINCVATDASEAGREDACSFYITVEDNEKPNITCPDNMTVSTDADVDFATFKLLPLNSSVDNTESFTVSINVDGTQLGIGGYVNLSLATGVHLVQYTATDNYTNSEMCDMFVTVIDDEDPELTCPEAFTVGTDFGSDTANVSWDLANVTDNSMESITPVSDPVSGSVLLPIGDTLVRFNATDKSGNNGSCTFLVTVEDDENPVVECPMDIENQTDDGQKYATVMWLSPNVTDNSNEIIPPTLSHTMAFMFPIGLTLVTVNATDSSNNTGSCNFTVNVLDLEPPEITCPGNQTNSTDLNVANVSLAVPAPLSASDNSELFNIAVFDVDGMTYMVGDPIVLDLATGPHLLQYVITDTAWNDTCDMYITVIDDEDPELTCPEAFTVGTDLGLATANVSWDLANVTDNSMESITPVSDPVSGSVLSIGDTPVRFNATDKSGNNGSCTFIVTVEDMEHPMINCSTNYTFSTSPGLPTAYVTYTEPEATDNVELFTTRCFPSGIGHEFNVGFHTIICVATDNSESRREDACSFYITVEDDEKPNITCPDNMTVPTDADVAFATFKLLPLNSSVDNTENFTVSINVDGTQLGIGDYVNLSLATGVHLVQYTATDNYTNSEMCDMFVTVNDDEDPKLTCPEAFTVGTDLGLATANVSWDLANVTDNSMESITPVSDPVSGSVLSIGDTPVRFNATDKSGNNGSCTFNVTVEDMERPMINCSTNYTFSTSLGLPTAYVTYTEPEATDNVGVTTTCVPTGAGYDVNVGFYTINCVATDTSEAGREDACSFYITVEDNEKPNITCPDNMTVPTDAGVAFATFKLLPLNSSVDNTENFTVSINVDGTQLGIGDYVNLSLATGVHLVQYTATDNYTNSEMCDMFVTVNDDEDPKLTCPEAFTVGTDLGLATANVSWDLANVTDNSMESITPVSDPVSGSVLSIGDTPVRFNATDKSGNNGSCTFNVTVEDMERPMINCSTNYTFSTSLGLPTAYVTYTEPEATDNVGVTTTCVPTGAGYDVNVGFYTINCVATDTSEAGREDACSFYITVEDNEKPNITCPDNMTVPTDAGVAFATFKLLPLNSSVDNTENFTVSINVDGTQLGIGDYVNLSLATGVHLVQYTATDNYTNSEMCDMFVTVNDDEDPKLTCPEAFTVGTDLGLATANVSWDLANVTDNSMESITPVSDPVSGSVLSIGDTPVRFNATDKSGNNGSCTFNVTVEDMERPMINCSTNYTFSTSPGLPTAYVTYTEPEATDNVGVTTTCVPTGAGYDVNVGFYTINCVATDTSEAGREDACSFYITVEDNEKPNITCPDNMTVPTDADVDFATFKLLPLNSSVDNTENFTVSINVDGTQLGIGDYVNLSLATGVHLVQYTATDNYTNSEMCDMFVTVNDEEVPVLVCPGNQTLVLPDGQLNATLTWPPPAVTDNSNERLEAFPSLLNGTEVVTGVANGRETTIVYNATDSAGNVGYCNFTIHVIDIEAPTITCPSHVIRDTDPQQNVTNNVTFVVTAADNSGEWTVSCTPASGTNFPVGVKNVQCNATDPSDNPTPCSFAVEVIGPPTILDCPASFNYYVASGVTQSNVPWIAPTALPELVTVMLTTDHEPGSSFTAGVTTLVTYTVMDNALRNATCSFNVSVIVDTQAPMIMSCPANISRMIPPGEASLSVNWTSPNASDNSGQVTLTPSHNPGHIFTVQTTQVIYTATDPFGLTDTCQFNVTISVSDDNTKPVISNCPANISTPTDGGAATALVSWTVPTATDNSGNVTLTSDFSPGFNFPIATTEVTYTAIDGSTNNMMCSFNVTVTDEENPTLPDCPDNFTLMVVLPTDTANADWMPPTAADNSGIVTRTMTLGPPPLSLPPGQHPVTYTAIDPAGLTDSCLFIITVQASTGCDINPCSNGGTCTPTANNGFSCSCSSFWMGTTCDEDVNECASDPANAECTARGLVCSNRVDPVGYTCVCPSGLVRDANSDNCIRGRSFRFRLTIVEINGTTAVFITGFGNSNTVIFLFHQTRLQILFALVFGRLNGFANVVVLFFAPGSIVVDGMANFNPDSTVTLEDVQNALVAGINTADLLMDSEYKVTPDSAVTLEEVCVDGYCQNGGNCVLSTTGFLSTCTCLLGYVGDRCERTDMIVTTPAPDGGGLSLEAIIAIAVGGSVALLLILLISISVCFLMMRGRRRGRQSPYMYREDYEGQGGPKRHRNGSLYDVHFQPRDVQFQPRDVQFQPRDNDGFALPYMASGRDIGIPLHRLVDRGDADYY